MSTEFKSNFSFFDENQQPLGERSKAIELDEKTWKKLNKISAKYAKKEEAIPLNQMSKKLFKSLMLIFIEHNGIPKGTHYIQR